MIPHSTRLKVILSLAWFSSLHAAFLAGDEGDEAWTQPSLVEDHPAGSLLWSRQTSRANTDTTTPPMTSPPETEHSRSTGQDDTDQASLTTLLVTLGSFPHHPASQSKVSKVSAYTKSPNQRRPEMRLSEAWVLKSKATAERPDDKGLKQMQTDLLTTRQDEFTRRPPQLGTNSPKGKHYRHSFSRRLIQIHSQFKEDIIR